MTDRHSRGGFAGGGLKTAWRKIAILSIVGLIAGGAAADWLETTPFAEKATKDDGGINLWPLVYWRAAVDSANPRILNVEHASNRYKRYQMLYRNDYPQEKQIGSQNYVGSCLWPLWMNGSTYSFSPFHVAWSKLFYDNDQKDKLSRHEDVWVLPWFLTYGTGKRNVDGFARESEFYSLPLLSFGREKVDKEGKYVRNNWISPFYIYGLADSGKEETWTIPLLALLSVRKSMSNDGRSVVGIQSMFGGWETRGGELYGVEAPLFHWSKNGTFDTLLGGWHVGDSYTRTSIALLVTFYSGGMTGSEVFPLYSCKKKGDAPLAEKTRGLLNAATLPKDFTMPAAVNKEDGGGFAPRKYCESDSWNALLGLWEDRHSLSSASYRSKFAEYDKGKLKITTNQVFRVEEQKYFGSSLLAGDLEPEAVEGFSWLWFWGYSDVRRVEFKRETRAKITDWDERAFGCGLGLLAFSDLRGLLREGGRADGDDGAYLPPLVPIYHYRTTKDRMNDVERADFMAACLYHHTRVGNKMSSSGAKGRPYHVAKLLAPTVSVDRGNDYSRHRVGLFGSGMLWDWERNGEDLSLDAVLGTFWYETKKDGYFNTSLLWRLFRYKKDPEKKTTSVDFLFIPVWR